MGKAGERWKTISEKDKAPYDELNKKDQQR
jgi:hypothetical protein